MTSKDKLAETTRAYELCKQISEMASTRYMFDRADCFYKFLYDSKPLGARK